MDGAAMNRREFVQRMAFLAALHAPLLSARNVFAAAPQPEMRIKRLRLVANNLAEQATFYRDVLQLPVEEIDSLVRVTAGTSQIEFSPSSDVERPFYHFAFNIPENQLNDAMAWLSPRCPIANIRDTTDKVVHFENLNAHSCYFFDPAGNILEFIAHHDVDNGTSIPFDASHMLRICEIGIVVPDVAATIDQVAGTLGLTPYRGFTNTFAPLGDINGVLIVCKKDRIWLPTTDVEAAVFPTHVLLEGTASQCEWDGLPYLVERV
jgi:catechol 2,3-dioxygenase-like lactoylglutathione lyase family enzyme